jgi:hypothetical protein
MPVGFLDTCMVRSAFESGYQTRYIRKFDDPKVRFSVTMQGWNHEWAAQSIVGGTVMRNKFQRRSSLSLERLETSNFIDNDVIAV